MTKRALLLLSVLGLIALVGIVRARPDTRSPEAGDVLIYAPHFERTGLPALSAWDYPVVVTPDPLIQSMIDQVGLGTVYSYTGDLTGQWPVEVGGTPYTITSRNTYSNPSLQIATQFVGEHLADLGLDVEYHTWDAAAAPNVIAELPGEIYPDEIVIICGHLDDVGFASAGADDNASGSVATLIAADILSRYRWAYTMRFALWTGEEWGDLGSDAYARRAYNNGENIVGVINLDMIAWSTPSSSPIISLAANSNVPPTLDLANFFADVVGAYGMDLIPEIDLSGGGGSDHRAFCRYGYTAILAIEDPYDSSPYYHTVDDTLSNLHVPYFTEFVKAAVGTFAHMGDPLGGLGYLSGTVSSLVTGDPIAGATVDAAISPDRGWSTTTDGSGGYQLQISSGVYTVTAVLPGYMSAITTGISVSTDQTSTLDLALVVTPTFGISGHARDASTGLPMSATISLSASSVPPVQTDPLTGLYVLTATVRPGSYVLQAEAAYYRSQSRSITLTHDRVEDFDLEPVCLLVVDDDGGMGYERYYVDALSRRGYYANLTASTPDSETLSHYPLVIWLTGDQDSDTLTVDDRSNLAAYLDAGGQLFLSGQNVGSDVGGTSFYTDYLHADYDSDDTYTDTLTGLGVFSGLDVVISGGDGADNQHSPSDVEPVNGGVAVYDYPAPHLYGGVAYPGTYRTLYFSFGFEGINNQADRDGVMSASMAYLGACGQPEPCALISGVDFDHDPLNPLVWETVSFSATVADGSAVLPLVYTWDFGDGVTSTVQTDTITHTFPFVTSAQTYTVSLTIANACPSQQLVTKTVTVQRGYVVYLPLVIRD